MDQRLATPAQPGGPGISTTSAGLQAGGHTRRTIRASCRPCSNSFAQLHTKTTACSCCVTASTSSIPSQSGCPVGNERDGARLTDSRFSTSSSCGNLTRPSSGDASALSGSRGTPDIPSVRQPTKEPGPPPLPIGMARTYQPARAGLTAQPAPPVQPATTQSDQAKYLISPVPGR